MGTQSALKATDRPEQHHKPFVRCRQKYLLSVNALAAGAITPREVTTLEHEILDNTVKSRALVERARKFSEVLGTLLPYRPITIRPGCPKPGQRQEHPKGKQSMCINSLGFKALRAIHATSSSQFNALHRFFAVY